MGKINNIVQTMEFRNEDDLFSQIDEFMSTDYGNAETDKPYKVSSINLIHEHKALVYLEEDLNVLPVHFFYCSDGEEIVPSEEAHNEEFMTIQEIKLICDLGSVTIEGREYDIDDIKYTINAYGTRYVNFYVC